MSEFSRMLRQWRAERRFSQLGLAGQAGISARHLSFLESRRANPSRDMVLRLAEALSMPRRVANSFLNAAGYAPIYPQTPLDDDSLDVVRGALERVMQNHLPYPAILMDRDWMFLDMNVTAKQLFGMAGIEAGSSAITVLDLPGGPSAWIENWPEVGHHLLARIQAENSATGGNPVLERMIARLQSDPGIAGYAPQTPLAPVMPTIYRVQEMRLSFISTFMQLGGVEDLSLVDLRVELMFPADQPTRQILEGLAA